MKDDKPLLSSAPAHSILNAQAFHYTNSAATDIRKKFGRVSRRREKADAASLNVASNVWPLYRRNCVDAIPNETRAKADAAITPPKPSAIADASVWLECSGELIDVRSVDVLRIREATPGIELIEFVCSRCRTPHASLRFG